MRTSTSRKFRAAALAAALLATTTAGALAMGPSGGHDPRHMLIHMTEKLELTDLQQEEIESLLTQSRSETEDDRARMEELKESLRDMRSEFNLSEAQLLSAELGEISGAMALERARTRAGIYQVLTPQQREKMAELEAMRDQRRQRRRPGV